VRESFARLGYVYDRAAASLRKNQSLAVGLVITQLSNPYFAELVVEGIQSELDDRGMDVLLGNLGRRPCTSALVCWSAWSERRASTAWWSSRSHPTSEPADFSPDCTCPS
jgi:hypothetical protein